ncbi:ferredoxin [Umezawaea endophytica]|uniref:Ferredoxin n=1 Tax=Umezawaea endophytica TaxID=1654476 RepID=A0A9X3A4S9_9PSEU|nr:(4Fe-4S)-binding protein [Umezawaea endophytica]MCS7483119.1 (4Fe-4S)-binding protein [Umezawaea endophytica]
MRIDVNDGRCVGAGQCVLNAPGLFDQDDEGMVKVLDQHPAGPDVAAVLQAVDMCPSGAINVTGF